MSECGFEKRRFELHGIKVAGVSFENRQDTIVLVKLLETLGQKPALKIIPEPDNSYDAYALGVWADLAGVVWKRIGYVPASLVSRHYSTDGDEDIVCPSLWYPQPGISNLVVTNYSIHRCGLTVDLALDMWTSFT